MRRVLPAIKGQAAVIFTVLHAYAWAGMLVWGGRLGPGAYPAAWDGSEPYYWLLNFNSYFESLVTLFAMLVVNNWNVIAEGYYELSGGWAYVFFVSFNCLAVTVAMNVMTAFFINAFQIATVRSALKTIIFLIFFFWRQWLDVTTARCPSQALAKAGRQASKSKMVQRAESAVDEAMGPDGKKAPPTTVQALVDLLGADEDGRVTRNDVVGAHEQLGLTTAEAGALFEALDHGRNGALSAAETFHVVDAYVDEAQLFDAMLADAGPDHEARAAASDGINSPEQAILSPVGLALLSASPEEFDRAVAELRATVKKSDEPNGGGGGGPPRDD